jgi:flagellar hook capping protein FlgD
MLQEEYPDRLIVVEEHVSQYYQCAWVSSHRAPIFNVSGVPHTVIDGITHYGGGGGTAQGQHDRFLPGILARMPIPSPVNISGIFAVGQSTVDVMATITLLDDVTLINPRVTIFCASGTVLGHDVPSQTYHRLVRDGYMEEITLVGQGSQVGITHSFPMDPSWDPEDMRMFVNVSKGVSGITVESYQTAELFIIPDFDLVFTKYFASVPEGNDYAEYQGTITNVGDVDDTITLSIDNDTGWTAEFMIEGEAAFHTSPSTIPFTVGEELEISVRVMTDGTLILDDVSFLTESATTDRVQVDKLRIFNASPAVLFVDDDNGYPQEELVLDALDQSFLYDNYNVVNDYGNVSPPTELLMAYDAVFWFTGWHHWGPLTADEMTSLMAFMDTGKPVVLCSQDYTTIPNATFSAGYLGLDSYTQNLLDPAISHLDGYAGDVITDGMSFDIVYTSSGYNRADDLVANAIGTPILQDVSGADVALRADNGTARSVFFAFSLEAVQPTHNENLNLLIEKSLDWAYGFDPQAVDPVDNRFVGSEIFSIGPNPLQAGGMTSTIHMRISDQAAQGAVKLEMIDITGRLVRQLVDGEMPVGNQAVSWDGLNESGRPVSAGVYYARMTTIDGVSSDRMVVLR